MRLHSELRVSKHLDEMNVSIDCLKEIKFQVCACPRSLCLNKKKELDNYSSSLSIN